MLPPKMTGSTGGEIISGNGSGRLFTTSQKYREKGDSVPPFAMHGTCALSQEARFSSASFPK